ncbi:MAG: ABC transporter ATP-binding protein [Promethearchaeota archaeon]|nr:MAG: ABC transporter ATP-binding protein [Candidatus Lokiarchaeota archaeon]
MNSLAMIIKYWLKSKKNFILAFILQLFSTICTTLIPIFIGRLVGTIDLNLPYNTNAINLWINFGIIIIFSVLAFFLNRTGRIKSAEVSSRAMYELRSDISNAIYRQSFSYFDKTQTGQLVSRATSDVEQTMMIFGFGLVHGILAIFQLVAVIVSTLLIQVYLALLFIIIIPIALISSYIAAMKLKPIYLETRESFGELTNTIRENIIGAEIVRIFSRQDKENKKFEFDNSRFLKANIRSLKFNTYLTVTNVIFLALLSILTLFIGGNLILQNLMTIDVLITFQSYIGLIGIPLMFFGQILLFYIQADAALTRIREVLESSPEIKNSPDAIPIENGTLKGEIIFDNVSFGYTSQNLVLKNISFKVLSGKKLAILGTTGSGKSTIINLLPRFYDIKDGTIKIDGLDIKKYLIKDLRKNIGIVSQDTFLFNKSIKENIAYGIENINQDEVVQAAKVADLHDFITSLPNQYDTIVGERGTRLSGGQKQRLSIARALIINPKILIFDDSTSSVDVETEYNIQQALEKIMKDTTTIIITQRISTIRNADLILVLDKGRVVGLGNHEKLIESNVLYKQIYQTLYYKQKSKELSDGE